MEEVSANFLLPSFSTTIYSGTVILKPETAYKCQEFGIEWQEGKISNESKNLKHIPWLRGFRNATLLQKAINIVIQNCLKR